MGSIGDDMSKKSTATSLRLFQLCMRLYSFHSAVVLSYFLQRKWQRWDQVVVLQLTSKSLKSLHGSLKSSPKSETGRKALFTESDVILTRKSFDLLFFGKCQRQMDGVILHMQYTCFAYCSY